jgi:hypothetical protein
VVVARDAGEVPQETSAFVTVRISGDSRESGEIEYTESPVTATVSAAGANEFAPEFESRQYSVEVLESADPGSSVLKVKAVDNDTGANGKISYSLRFDDNGNCVMFLNNATARFTFFNFLCSSLYLQ